MFASPLSTRPLQPPARAVLEISTAEFNGKDGARSSSRGCTRTRARWVPRCLEKYAQKPHTGPPSHTISMCEWNDRAYLGAEILATRRQVCKIGKMLSSDYPSLV
ncbi:hypothetical protein RRG08_028053 [Elysia crispata]|uniref:Uncharacterized protein n=1 Tax=Elysia crispata TaxID=231223 RepID=A0AAE1A7Q0_9GAST|nr:hypothetical protein RRG08_028053 [Elysia crispata]